MKKLWLMLLIGCTAGAFSACSDKEDNPKPQNPITEYTVPSTAEIGGFYTVTGKGFATTAQLYLRNASGTETATTDPTVASTGITVTIPSNLTAGVYTVVVKQDGSWDLGQVRLAEAQNPVSSVVMPEAIKLNKPFEIAGNGFTADSKIFLETADAAKTRTELTVTVTPTGVSCAIPEGVAAGTYHVILKQNNIDWTLGENIPAAVYKRIKEFKISQSTTYDKDNMDMSAFREMIKQMLESEMQPGETVPDEMLDMYVEMYMAFFESSSGVRADELYVYNAEGRLTTVQKPNGGGVMSDWFVFSYDGDKVSATNEQFDGNTDKSFVWNMNDGKVESATVDYGKKSYDYNWTYDSNGYFTGSVNASNSSPYITLGYTNGNFSKVAIQTSGDPAEKFKYDKPALKNNIFGVDVAKALLHFSFGGATFSENFLFANALGIMGKPSVNMPSAIIESEESTIDYLYTHDADGYATSVKWGTSGMDPMFGVCPVESATEVEFIYE